MIKYKDMNNIFKNKNQRGFIQIIILIIIALLIMRYFGWTITGILNYFNLTWIDIVNWLKSALNWFKDLFNSVK